MLGLTSELEEAEAMIEVDLVGGPVFPLKLQLAVVCLRIRHVVQDYIRARNIVKEGLEHGLVIRTRRPVVVEGPRPSSIVVGGSRLKPHFSLISYAAAPLT